MHVPADMLGWSAPTDAVAIQWNRHLEQLHYNAPGQLDAAASCSFAAGSASAALTPPSSGMEAPSAAAFASGGSQTATPQPAQQQDYLSAAHLTTFHDQALVLDQAQTGASPFPPLPSQLL
jgi:hypothetical protein